MSKIRLHGSSSGYMEIAPPAAGSSETITLPNSAGEVLLTDGSAASLTQIPAANIVGVCTAGLGNASGAFGQGKILQVVQFRKTDEFSSSTNGFVDIGVGKDITPAAASSKFLITAAISGATDRGSGGVARIVRTIDGSASNLGLADADGSRSLSGFTGHLYTADGTNSEYMSLVSQTQFLDTPSYSLGDTINYKIQCHPEALNLRINFQESSQNNSYDGVQTCSYITIMEIGS